MSELKRIDENNNMMMMMMMMMIEERIAKKIKEIGKTWNEIDRSIDGSEIGWLREEKDVRSEIYVRLGIRGFRMNRVVVNIHSFIHLFTLFIYAMMTSISDFRPMSAS